MGAFDTSGAAAGMQASLDDLIKQKFLQQIEARHALEGQQQNAIQQGQLGQGQQRIDQEGAQFGQTMGLNRDKLGEDRRQFDATSAQANQRIGMEKELQPVRIKHMTAQTADLERQPQEAIDTRNFQTARDKTLHGYQLGEIGASGANALAVANVRHPDTAGTSAAAAQANEVQDAADLIDQIMQDKALDESVGPVDNVANSGVAGYLGRVRDPAGIARFNALHDQLTGKMSLAQAGKLKGQGQISDKERAMLAAAATALSRGLSEKDYKAELTKIRGQFERMGAKPSAGASAGGTIRARDPQGGLHEAPAGTTLPQGWTLER